jgi:hypothetical protein
VFCISRLHHSNNPFYFFTNPIKKFTIEHGLSQINEELCVYKGLVSSLCSVSLFLHDLVNVLRYINKQGDSKLIKRGKHFESSCHPQFLFQLKPLMMALTNKYQYSRAGEDGSE